MNPYFKKVIIREIPKGDQNEKVRIEATPDGIVIDYYILIEWNWVYDAIKDQALNDPGLDEFINQLK